MRHPRHRPGRRAIDAALEMQAPFHGKLAFSGNKPRPLDEGLPFDDLGRPKRRPSPKSGPSTDVHPSTDAQEETDPDHAGDDPDPLAR
jgi:hypothetical protein